jgi:hypothetical protein
LLSDDLQKISVLQHAPSAHLPARPGDPTPTRRNLDPLQHPFARARERIRALNAAKMERMFSKPFIAALEGHADAVEALARRPNSITDVASASWDGGETRLSSSRPQTLVKRTVEQTSLFITLGGGRTSRKSQARIRGRYPAFAGLTTREY